MDYKALIKGKFEDPTIRDALERIVFALEINDRVYFGQNVSKEDISKMLEVAMFAHTNSGFLATMGPMFRPLVSEALYERGISNQPALPHFVKRAIPTVESLLNDKWPSGYRASRADMAASIQ